MRDHTLISISPHVIGQPPRRLGVNVELQMHADQSNLWDWLVDSGATVARSFHPEQCLRREELVPESSFPIEDAKAFEAWRQSLKNDVQKVRWEDYRFSEELAWMGTPDDFCRRYAEHNLAVLGSLGHGPKHFPRSLLKAGPTQSVPDDDGIDWGAAACAYEYYFAVILHFSKHHGLRDFLMINEPENRFGQWYLSPELEGMNWEQLFWKDEGASLRYQREVGAQLAVMCRLARWAMDDVADLLQRKDLRLIGPTTVCWEVLWGCCRPYLDAYDWHHYHPTPESFALSHAAVSTVEQEKPLFLSEFNLYSGGMRMPDSNLIPETAERTAAMLMQVLSLPAGQTPIDTATLYLFAGPSTHRNHKHMVYGDLNTLDFDGTDRPLWDRGEAWVPRFEELQLRHPTRVYHYFRMLSRHTQNSNAKAHAVGLSNPTSSGPFDVAFHWLALATQNQEAQLLTLLNPSSAKGRGALRMPKPAFAIVRLTDARHSDEVIEARWCDEETLPIEMPPHAMLQVLCLPKAPFEAPQPKIVDISLTPGTCTDLGLHQTLRLRVEDQQGREVEEAVRWSSSDPERVWVGQGGLVQRKRAGGADVTLTATLLPSGRELPLVIPPST